MVLTICSRNKPLYRGRVVEKKNEMHGDVYLSIYLPIRLNPRGGHQTGSGEPSAGG